MNNVDCVRQLQVAALTASAASGFLNSRPVSHQARRMYAPRCTSH